MAKIWRVYEGREPTRGGPWMDLPLSEAISIFDMRPENFLSDGETKPRFGNVDRDLWYAGHKHIVVEVEYREVQKTNWPSGFYLLSIDPDEAFDRVIEHALEIELGKRNVIRWWHEPTTDSQGRDALKITVVIAPGATKTLKGGATLDAIVELQKRLHIMQDDRTPIIHYATEAELAQDGGS